MRKLKMLVVAMLVFMMSAQTVLGAAVPKANAENEAAEVVETAETESLGIQAIPEEEQVSVNELQPEALQEVVKEINLKNEWDSYCGIEFEDINGSQVNMNGAPGCIKIVMFGWEFDTEDPYCLEFMEWLEKQFAEVPQVKFVVFDDAWCLSADELREYVSGYAFSKRMAIVDGEQHSKVMDELDDYVWSILTHAFGNDVGAYGVMLPILYVIDSNNTVRFVSVGNYVYEGTVDKGLYQLVNYVNGMEEITNPADGVEVFVTRLYAYALGRKPDTAGLNDWVTRLKSKQITGTTAARGFFDSDELKNRKLSNEQYVELLYRVMMGRSADAAGKAYWVNMLKSGVSRMGVFNGFAGSTEFDNICKEYGIDRGAVTASEGRDKNYGVTQFVSRLYTQALGRSYDVDGLNDWCNRIVSKTWSVTDVSTTGFFHSREFANKNLNNEQYVKVLYRTFLGREYDAAGLKDWVGKLNSGAMSRDEVLKGFSYSTEFANIMKQYGL